tara:strand:+ start:4570 stop:4677 length:108 start_codon:yes stop_codon:yes gene_type:complete
VVLKQKQVVLLSLLGRSKSVDLLLDGEGIAVSNSA